MSRLFQTVLSTRGTARGTFRTRLEVTITICFAGSSGGALGSKTKIRKEAFVIGAYRYLGLIHLRNCCEMSSPAVTIYNLTPCLGGVFIPEAAVRDGNLDRILAGVKFWSILADIAFPPPTVATPADVPDDAPVTTFPLAILFHVVDYSIGHPVLCRLFLYTASNRQSERHKTGDILMPLHRRNVSIIHTS